MNHFEENFNLTPNARFVKHTLLLISACSFTSLGCARAVPCTCMQFYFSRSHLVYAECLDAHALSLQQLHSPFIFFLIIFLSYKRWCQLQTLTDILFVLFTHPEVRCFRIHPSYTSVAA